MGKVNNENNEEMADLFDKDLRKIKSARYNDMDDSFYSHKKGHRGLVVFIIMLLLIAFLGYYYYFIIDNPKNIFTTIANKTFNGIKIDDVNSVSYSLSINGKSEDNDINNILNIINKMSFEGIIGKDDNKQVLSGIINYEEKKLINYNLLLDMDDVSNLYAKFDNISDEIIKFNIDTEELADYDKDTNNYAYVGNKIIDTIKDTIKDANYSKTIVKYKQEYVKKATMKINEKFISKVINELLQDDEFMEDYSKIVNADKSDVADMLNKIIDDAKNTDDELNIYLGMINNKFMKLEYVSLGSSIVIEKDNNKYNYVITEDYTEIADGYIKISDSNKKNKVLFSINDYEDKISLEMDFSYSLKDNDIKILDKSKATAIEEMNEEDMMEIIENISKNEALLKLIDDLGLSEVSESYLSMM